MTLFPSYIHGKIHKQKPAQRFQDIWGLASIMDEYHSDSYSILFGPPASTSSIQSYWHEERPPQTWVDFESFIQGGGEAVVKLYFFHYVQRTLDLI